MIPGGTIRARDLRVGSVTERGTVTRRRTTEALDLDALRMVTVIETTFSDRLTLRLRPSDRVRAS